MADDGWSVVRMGGQQAAKKCKVSDVGLVLAI